MIDCIFVCGWLRITYISYSVLNYKTHTLHIIQYAHNLYYLCFYFFALYWHCKICQLYCVCFMWDNGFGRWNYYPVTATLLIVSKITSQTVKNKILISQQIKLIILLDSVLLPPLPPIVIKVLGSGVFPMFIAIAVGQKRYNYFL